MSFREWFSSWFGESETPRTKKPEESKRVYSHADLSSYRSSKSEITLRPESVRSWGSTIEHPLAYYYKNGDRAFIRQADLYKDDVFRIASNNVLYDADTGSRLHVRLGR